MIELREYQKEISSKGLEILKSKSILYLAMEVRTGKTLTALNIANNYKAKKVLFLTKKKAVESSTIMDDYNKLNPSFEIVIINNESLHKVLDNDFDLLVSDEHHRNGSFPKPNKTTKEIKKRFSHLPMIFLSGTPTPESGSQFFHQFWISSKSPFKQYSTFYKWADKYVTVKMKYFGAIQAKDYSHSNDEEINKILSEYIITYTQKDAGFNTDITEKVIYYEMPSLLHNLSKKLLKDEIIIGTNDNIVADSASAMMNKIHQIENGTVILESGNTIILDKSKAVHIKEYFYGSKIAIFYYFKKELELLQEVFGDTITTDINEFNSTEKNFVIQQVSGSEAISLKKADVLVYYNYGYSGKNYIQGRDRMTTIDREENNVYFFIAKGSINERIYKAIKNKKKYNEKLFIKDYGYRESITD